MTNDYFMESETYTTQMDDMPTKGTQKHLNMFFIVDVSGSMRKEGRIQAVNEAFTNMVPILREVQRDCMAEFELNIAIMTFDQEARWIVPPTPILEYNHKEIECSQWGTYFSKAFKTLGGKLTKSEYMAYTGKIVKPYIMLMTDGEPTEGDNYEPEIDKLLKNDLFSQAQRFAVLIGNDTIHSASARATVEKFVSNSKEGIIDAEDAFKIAAEVQAKTLHTVINMTKHNVADTLGESQKHGSDIDNDERWEKEWEEVSQGFKAFGDEQDFI